MDKYKRLVCSWDPTLVAWKSRSSSIPEATKLAALAVKDLTQETASGSSQVLSTLVKGSKSGPGDSDGEAFGTYRFDSDGKSSCVDVDWDGDTGSSRPPLVSILPFVNSLPLTSTRWRSNGLHFG
jgi:hypothetical protein